GEQFLREVLVHRDRARQNPAARVRNPEPLEDPLNHPVFAAGSVQRVEDDVGRHLANVVDEAVIEVERSRRIFKLLERAQNARSALNRNVAFGAGAAHDDGDFGALYGHAVAFTSMNSPTKCTSNSRSTANLSCTA